MMMIIVIMKAKLLEYLARFQRLQLLCLEVESWPTSSGEAALSPKPMTFLQIFPQENTFPLPTTLNWQRYFPLEVAIRNLLAWDLLAICYLLIF